MTEPTTTTPLPIVYQDEHLVVINKPTGLLVHRSPIDKRETRFAVQELRNQIGQQRPVLAAGEHHRFAIGT